MARSDLTGSPILATHGRPLMALQAIERRPRIKKYSRGYWTTSKQEEDMIKGYGLGPLIHLLNQWILPVWLS